MAGTPGVAAKVFSCARHRRASTCARSRRAPPSATSPWWSRAQRHPRAARGARRALPLPAHALDRRHRTRARSGGCCSSSSPRRASGCAQQFKLDLRVRGLLSSQRMLLADPGIELDQLARAVRRSTRTPADLARFVEHVRVDYLPHTVLIDCTRQCRGRGALRRLARRGHPCRHAEQEGQQRRLRRLPARCSDARARTAARTISTRRPSVPGCR